ncbi:hypothetical protein CY34DRAFT_186357 [Suillus luteus UH-Slu-Lm8-n1]|uniref:Uncharacterized protein n=1 Tax=Suillus luteus UH-Slu-Lm8-n1 TaxID=930992 RepID=A0A0D0A1S5_9AGAM|nr:hypothetical protein CY34DRAFT_186357 [Suillus luteus UH-Slu-Lm8-n1]
MGVFDFTDTSSAISLAQFVLGLRTHFEDIKGATSIEAVDSLTPLHWRSDVPDFETQFWGQSDERVASWTQQVYVQMSASDAPSSSSTHTPSPLLDTARVYETMHRNMPIIAVEGIEVDIRRQDSGTTSARGSGKRPKSKASSAYSNSQFAALSDNGLGVKASISNWLFERHAYTIGRVKIVSELANKTEINAMIDFYDRMTVFTWSDEIKVIMTL